ncbi:MAG: OmpH family outer membrane protein [Alphaproteobacteria bacterium]
MRCLSKIVLGGTIGVLSIAVGGGVLLGLGIISPTTLEATLNEWFPKKSISPGEFIPLAVVNMTKVRDEAEVFKTIKSFSDQQKKAIYEEFLVQENLLRKESEEIKKQEAAQKETPQELNEKKTAFNKKCAEVEQQVQQKKITLDRDLEKRFALVEEKFYKIIADAAGRYHARVVIDSTATAILYAEGVDLTDIIIQDLNQQTAGFTVSAQES